MDEASRPAAAYAGLPPVSSGRLPRSAGQTNDLTFNSVGEGGTGVNLGVKAPRNPISRAQIETVISRSVAGVALVFSLQCLPMFFSQLDQRIPVLSIGLASAIALSVIALVVTAIVKRGVSIVATVITALYFIELVAWPFLMKDPSTVLDGAPWLWYLCTVATSCAAIAFPLVWAATYTVVIPLIYGLLRTTPAGGGKDLALASLDAVYAILLGFVVLIIITLLRQATAAVDIAQTNALTKYAVAVRQHATELERVEVDSIVHDSVLTTLLSAASAETPKAQTLAATMAGEAITRLSDAGAVHSGDDIVIPLARLSHRIREAAEAFASPFTVVEEEIEFLSLPVHASEALYSASVQAMVNSTRHAGPPSAELTRTLVIKANQRGGCIVEISDNGVGFDPLQVPHDRLGLRVSILERVSGAGGAVRVFSRVGEGTTITIEWPDTDAGQNSVLGQFSSDEIPALGLDVDQEDERSVNE
ncbi:hypothetical protein GCM10022381_16770 [Leifsonia kafniensis]|uniref:Histidine kinase/HSP90-like ATPase domain-containing protein n=1 Tax=Leifsonia kafniensis TaxID=475957 RepID=A0ABP7KEC8_9MICO